MSKINDMLVSKTLHAADYNPTHEAMRVRILERIALKKEQNLRTPDELWIVDHNDVYTLGQASKKEHILQQTDTPIIQTDRGGQVTWHGHGQLVIYWLFDLNSLDWSVRQLVSHAEQALEDVINELFLNPYNKTMDANFYAKARRDAPGVYIYADSQSAQPDEAIMLGKIASLGFKIKHGFSYHGLALNISCDLAAFNAINPCGYAGMQMLRLSDFINMDKDRNENAISYTQITQKLIDNIARRHAGDITLRPVLPKS